MTLVIFWAKLAEFLYAAFNQLKNIALAFISVVFVSF